MPIELSMVIPHMDRPADLLQTLHLLTAQTSPDFEVVVANVGPIPTLNPQDYPFAINLVPVPGDWNCGRARNVGARAANCERLMFLDCDVTAPADLVAGAVQIIRPRRVWFPIIRNSFSDYNADADLWRIRAFGECGITKTDLHLIEGWDEFHGWGGEDTLLAWKCAQNGLEILRAKSGLIHRDHSHVSPWHAHGITQYVRIAAAKRQWRLRHAPGRSSAVENRRFAPLLQTAGKPANQILPPEPDPPITPPPSTPQTTSMGASFSTNPKHNAADKKMPLPVYRIWPRFVRSQKAFDSWKEFPLIDVPAVMADDPRDLVSCQIACSNSHAEALRRFLSTNATHSIVIEDDAVLVDRSWLSFTDFDYFMPFISHRDQTPGKNFTIRHDLIPLWGTQAYIASRRFARAYIPLLEAGGISDVVNLQAAIGLRVASFTSNAVIHDNHAVSLLSEDQRLAHFDRMNQSQSSGLLVIQKPKTKCVPQRPRGVSFCTLCKGRRHHLQQTLAENLDIIRDRDAEIVLVDFNSDDGLAGWLAAHFTEAIQSGLLQFHQLQDDLPFSIPIGKNFAHRLARKEILVNLDADNFIGDLWEAAQMLAYNEFLACDEVGKGTFGRIGLWRGDFEKLRGYNEACEPAGYYDIDLTRRARRIGLRNKNWPTSRPALQHDKSETMTYLGGGGHQAWLLMQRRNQARCLADLENPSSKTNPSGFTPARFYRNFSEIVALKRDCCFPLQGK